MRMRLPLQCPLQEAWRFVPPVYDSTSLQVNQEVRIGSRFARHSLFPTSMSMKHSCVICVLNVHW